MQTFLPYEDFGLTAKCLDYKRLGKQRVEAMQILDINMYDTKSAWSNHPCVKMWRGYEICLVDYINHMIREWIVRGYKNTMKTPPMDWNKVKVPPFIGNKEFHDSHKSNLLRKDPVYYGKYGWNVPDNLPYMWKGW